MRHHCSSPSAFVALLTLAVIGLYCAAILAAVSALWVTDIVDSIIDNTPEETSAP